MLYSNLELLRHIYDEVIFIQDSLKDKDKNDLFTDGILSRAIVRSLEIIGEASKKIDDEFKASHPYIEWRKMAGTRDRLIHNYFGVDYDIVWDLIQNKIPGLQESISEIFKHYTS